MNSASIFRFPLVIAAGVLLSVGTLAAQDGGMPSQQGPSPQNMPTPDQQGPGGANSNMSNYIAAEFVRNTFENDLFQVKMSELAQQKSTSDDVKQFSEQMVNVHNKLDEQLTPLAKQLSVGQPKGPAKKDKKELEKLQSLSGEGFENEYLQAMGSAQKQSLKTFEKEAKDTSNPNAQQAAKMDTPVLEQNYQVLQKVAQAHNVNLQEQASK